MIETKPISTSELTSSRFQRIKQMIWVTFQKEGVHYFPGADTDPKYATGDWDDVSFLGYPHRHIFHFRVWIDVSHNNREIEFIQFKRWCERLYSSDSSSQVLSLDHKSCEMIAEELHTKIIEFWGERTVYIEVSEDGENGCYMEFVPVPFVR